MDFFTLGGARAVFTDRAGGASSGVFSSLNLGFHVQDDPAAVAQNRRLLSQAAQAEVAWMEQVHSATVMVLTGPQTEIPVADALIIDRRDETLWARQAHAAQMDPTAAWGVAVMVADCVPILLADSTGMVVAAVHAGRASFAGGIIPATLAELADRGVSAAQLSAALGPAACGRCYEVPARMQAELVAQHPATRARTRQGTAGLDIRAGAQAQLEAAGLANVISTEVCTIESAQYFSYRRQARTGRQCGLVIAGRN